MKPQIKYCPCCGKQLTFQAAPEAVQPKEIRGQADCQRCGLHALGTGKSDAAARLAILAAERSLSP